MATGLHAQNNGVNRRVLLQVSAVQTAQLPVKLQASHFCAGSVVFIELSDTAQSGGSHTDVISVKSIQKGTIPSSTVTQQTLRETQRLKSSETQEKKLQIPLLHPTKCSVDGWYSSNRSYENSTQRVRVSKAVSTGPGSENSPKACS